MAKQGSKAKRRKKSNTRLTPEIRIQQVEIQESARTTRTFIRAAAWIGVVALVAPELAEFAGEETLVKVTWNWLMELKAPSWVAGLFGFSGYVYGERQRKLKNKTVASMGGRVRRLEKSLDPERSSSRLTREGETRPEDDR